MLTSPFEEVFQPSGSLTIEQKRNISIVIVGTFLEGRVLSLELQGTWTVWSGWQWPQRLNVKVGVIYWIKYDSTTTVPCETRLWQLQREGFSKGGWCAAWREEETRVDPSW